MPKIDVQKYLDASQNVKSQIGIFIQTFGGISDRIVNTNINDKIKQELSIQNLDDITPGFSDLVEEVVPAVSDFTTNLDKLDTSNNAVLEQLQVQLSRKGLRLDKKVFQTFVVQYQGEDLTSRITTLLDYYDAVDRELRKTIKPLEDSCNDADAVYSGMANMIKETNGVYRAWKTSYERWYESARVLIALLSDIISLLSEAKRQL